ncbi:MAG: hypothetical protein ACREVR_13050, partial [Burkholderiales bacterium]
RLQRIRITAHVQKKQDAEAGQLLNDCIGPLFYRARKSELGLAPQDFKVPTLVVGGVANPRHFGGERETG